MAEISVIIPAYNAAATLAETLDSVARQTRQPLEVVVVDDGSTDGTAAVANSFADRLPRLMVLTVENGGVSKARNRAIAAASGELIAPLDADDIWHPTYLAKMAAAIEPHPDCAFAYCFHRRIDGASKVLTDGRAHAAEGWAFYQMLVQNYVGNGSAIMFWRDRALAVDGYDSRVNSSEDFDLQLNLAWRGEVRCVAEHLVGYRVVVNSLSFGGERFARTRLKLSQLLPEKIAGIRQPFLRHTQAERHAFLGRTLKRVVGVTPEQRQHARTAWRLDAAGMAVARLRLGYRPEAPSAARGADFMAVDPALPGSLVPHWLIVRRVRKAAIADAAHGRQMALALDSTDPVLHTPANLKRH